jgi:glycerol-3-phosphate dehydrogenase (NAD(P)+)
MCTTLQTRTEEQAARLAADRENQAYLPGVALPSELRVETVRSGLSRADFVFLGVPSRGLEEVIEGLGADGLPERAAVISLAKGLVPPDGRAPTMMLRRLLGEHRVACLGGPAHAREMVHEGAGLVAAPADEELAAAIARAFTREGVVCERSNDPVGGRAGRGRQERGGAGPGRDGGPGPQRGGRGRRSHLRRGVALRRASGRTPRVAHRPGRHR